MTGHTVAARGALLDATTCKVQAREQTPHETCVTVFCVSYDAGYELDHVVPLWQCLEHLAKQALNSVALDCFMAEIEVCAPLLWGADHVRLMCKPCHKRKSFH